MSQVYVGNLDPRVTATDIEHEFQSYGDIRSVNLPRQSPGGYGFVEFEERSDALKAVRQWSGKYGWRVELSRNSRFPSVTNGGGCRGGDVGRFNCYRCGEPGHFARDCQSASDKKKGVRVSQKKGVKISYRGRKKKDQAASTSTWKPVSPPPPPWLELPQDVMAKILQKLGPIDILQNAQKVCTTWRRICKDPAMWRVIDMWKLDNGEEIDYDLEAMCRHAVRLSEGELVEINIEYFATDKLLEYIARRSGKLRCMRLARCHEVSVKGLRKAVAKLSSLQELYLQFTQIDTEGIEAVGQACPMLKSFTMIDFMLGHSVECDREALAVAKSMPELRHLGFFGSKMTNDGLLAILNGCPKLESLDLRQCYNIHLDRELGKRCDQIKELKLPGDSTHDCDFDIDLFGWGHYADFSDIDSFYDYYYEDFDYDDFCNPYDFSDDDGFGFMGWL